MRASLRFCTYFMLNLLSVSFVSAIEKIKGGIVLSPSHKTQEPTTQEPSTRALLDDALSSGLLERNLLQDGYPGPVVSYMITHYSRPDLVAINNKAFENSKHGIEIPKVNASYSEFLNETVKAKESSIFGLKTYYSRMSEEVFTAYKKLVSDLRTSDKSAVDRIHAINKFYRDYDYIHLGQGNDVNYNDLGKFFERN